MYLGVVLLVRPFAAVAVVPIPQDEWEAERGPVTGDEGVALIEGPLKRRIKAIEEMIEGIDPDLHPLLAESGDGRGMGIEMERLVEFLFQGRGPHREDDGDDRGERESTLSRKVLFGVPDKAGRIVTQLLDQL